jgi:hypothetical protein
MTFRNVVVIRHKVANYRKWKSVFEAHAPSRLAHGCLGTHIFRRADSPKELVVMLAWSDIGTAREGLEILPHAKGWQNLHPSVPCLAAVATGFMVDRGCGHNLNLLARGVGAGRCEQISVRSDGSPRRNS